MHQAPPRRPHREWWRTRGADPDTEEPALVTAFFGLDDTLPPIAAALCAEAPGMDGLVVVVADRLATVTVDQFEVVSQSGTRRTPTCATLAPANEPVERRTVLLIGDLGSAATDPPVEVVTPRALDTEVVGDGERYAGRSIAVTPLPDGPSPVAAEWAEPTPDCPATTTAVLRVAWSGGIVLVGGAEPDPPPPTCTRSSPTTRRRRRSRCWASAISATTTTTTSCARTAPPDRS